MVHHRSLSQWVGTLHIHHNIVGDEHERVSHRPSGRAKIRFSQRPLLWRRRCIRPNAAQSGAGKEDARKETDKEAPKVTLTMTYRTAHIWIGVWTGIVSLLCLPLSPGAGALCAAIGLVAMLLLRKEAQ